MTDSFRGHSRSLTSPPEQAAAIAADDGRDLAFATRAIWVGGAGDLRVRMLGGAEVTLGQVPAGSLLPLRVVRVLATGTSATGLVGLW
jgi:hypothetical protein